ncbi:KR domain-containing protein [Microdochium trichocladiopsis]|uniref:KR domain-containing protein n=1 Tax=Microdochium trichocladiopsis TaxID=1682393 RepID=A0A9P8XYI8_9PEZI|nr:KR domain-containing protein [Microdochium trichocladiopsis]KAH7021375.1 KR domain-containing protein [Microdochium trichocladiopsis]
MAEPIAICGMALRLPAGVSTPSQFWEFLVNKRDAQGPIPGTRYSAAKYFSKAGKAGFVKAERGYFLDESVDLGGLDTTLFTMPKNEVERADPQQRILLELTRECLESAGEVNYRGKQIGTFVGSFGEDWSSLFAKDDQVPAVYKVTGYGDFVLSNRLAYEYDLRGPSMTIRTGCSSALIGLHQACLAIRAGDCDSAIVGGSNLLLAPGLTSDLSEQMVLSPTGSCKTFDADADGYARGEAVNVIYVKRLTEAIRDGNPVRAVIRGTYSNSDGKKSGLTMPSFEGHAALIRKTYQVAGIADPAATPFVECHGTGTSVGDPIETRAVAQVFGDRGVYIGSVKPNVGHSEGASGLTSLIKVVLALEHRSIPPNIKFNNLNPKIPFKEKKLVVPTELTPWPEDRVERASVNSFGIGGANTHVVIDSAQSFLGCKSVAPMVNSGVQHTAADPHLVVLSANTSDSLRRQIENHRRYLEDNTHLLPEIAYILSARRDHLPYRTFAVVGQSAEINTSPTIKVTNTILPRLAFVFTGQGAQWAQMGSELLTSSSIPAFAKTIRRLDATLSRLQDGPSWSIADELTKTKGESNVSQAAYSQPLCTAVQIALVDVLTEYGIRAHAVVGHSSGELAAAYAAGKLTGEEAIIAAYYRGVVSKHAKRSGAMAALGMSWEDVKPLLLHGVVVACENSPANVTISGDREQLASVLAAVKERDASTFARELKVDKAYHLHHMEEVGELYESLLVPHLKGDSDSALKPTEGTSRDTAPPSMFSSVTGQQLLKMHSTGSRYWRSNLESPVLFRKAVGSLVEHHANGPGQGVPLVFLELGPHSALAGPLRQTLAEREMNAPYSSCLIRDKNAVKTLLAALGQLWQQNVSIDFGRLTNPHGMRDVATDLPTYPWQHDHSLLFETRLQKLWRSPRARKHEILGVRVIESTDNEPLWRNVLHLAAVPWLRDHNVKGDIVFPCAGYVGMIGEAIRQLTAITDGGNDAETPFTGFSIRGMVIDTAMLLSESRSTEVLTSLTRHRLTDSLESDRWDFVVSSHNGAVWTKHCAGQVCSMSPLPTAEEAATVEKCLNSKFPRHVEASKWYKVMREVGGNYGPTFQGLDNITCSTTGNEASATAKHTVQDAEEFYAVHPTKIDFFLQLLAAAAIQGVGHRMRTMAVPTYIAQLDVHVAESELTLSVSATASASGVITGGGTGCSRDLVDGKSHLVLNVCGVKISPLHGDISDDNPDPHAGARMHWREDIDFADMPSMVIHNDDQLAYADDMQELTALCIRDSLRLLDAEGLLEPPTDHLRKFLDWMRRQPLPKTDTTVDSLLTVLRPTDLECVALALQQVLNNIVPLFRGTVDSLEVLMQDGILTDVYKMINWSKRPRLFQALAHANPRMRILEIGAGTGGTTEILLGNFQAMQTSHSHRMYGSYTYTDISAGFFGAAQERFKQHVDNMEFRVLDISKDPCEQGFEEHGYDLVVASNVLHATPSLVSTLRNVRRLLKPEGRLYIEELSSEHKPWNYIMGILPGWWLGEADGRPDEPYVTPERWDIELRKAGFGGIENFALDCPGGKHSHVFLLARPYVDCARAKDVTVIFNAASEPQATVLERCLTSAGYSVALHDFDETGNNSAPVEKDIVSVLDLAEPFLDEISPARLKAFQDLMRGVSRSGTGILWLTRPSQLEGQCSDPRWAQIQGAARTIRAELVLDLATCEVETLDENLCPIVERVLGKFMRRRNTERDERLDPEFEYAIGLHGSVSVPRIYPFNIADELRAATASLPLAETASSRLEIDKPGRLSTLHWVSLDTGSPGDDELLIEPRAVGINFRDILGVMGIVNIIGLGLEHAGIVRAVGSNVEGDIKLGDRVMVMGGYGLTSMAKVSKYQCVKIPDSLSFVDAATMATVFATVIYGLLDIGRMRGGQTILIHSACGGVGLAALQIARMVGAGQIYCTVSSEAKKSYLQTELGIPHENIFYSRDVSFRANLMRATNGRGVDLVLNSLSGELLHASWECVAEFGTMVEIGKRDLLGHGRLALEPFLLNRSYQCVDLSHLIEHRPTEGQRLLKLVIQYYREGYIEPISPIIIFPVEEVRECFLHMQKGQHIGKIVVDMQAKYEGVAGAVATSARPFTFQFDSGAAYILVVGLGGLGRAVSTWMVENGARHLIYLGRTAGASAHDVAFMEELRSQGCSVASVPGSVTILADVEQAVAAAGTRPLKGIINMSMVLRDHNFATMSHEDWESATAPKVRGTWNLHKATVNTKLDFFLLFSSVSATYGHRGQANYAAANTFLDAFVRYRHGCGLPAQSVNVGIMLDHGYVADNDSIRERLVSRGNYGIHISELLDSLSAVLAAPVGPKLSTSSIAGSCTTATRAQLGLGIRSTLSMRDSSNRVIFKTDQRMAVYWNDEAGDTAAQGRVKSSSAQAGKIAALIATARNDDPSVLSAPETAEFMARQIAGQLLALLLRPLADDEIEAIDVSRPPQDLGLDSLVAIELRSWWKATLQFDVSVLELLALPTLLAIGQRAVDGLK